MGMHCTRCRYDLDGLTNRSCPECGTPFEPTDQTTWAAHRSRLRCLDGYQASCLYAIVLASIPGLCVASLLMTWGSAWLALGHEPVPYINDPKNIDSLLVTIFSNATALLLLGIVAAVILIVPLLLILGVMSLLDATRRGLFARTLALVIVLMGAAWAVNRMLPDRIFEWFID